MQYGNPTFLSQKGYSTMSRIKASVTGVPIGLQLPSDGGFTVYIDEFGNAVCGTPPWVKTQANIPSPVATTEPVPNADVIGHGHVSHMPTPIAALPEQTDAIYHTDPVILAPIEEFPYPQYDPTVKWDPTTKWDTSIDGGIVCFIPPGTVHEYLPGDNPATPAPVLPPVQPADLNDQGPPDVLYYEPPVAAPPEVPVGPWSGPYPAPTPEPGPVGVHIDDGGFVVYIDENGNAVCGYPPPGYGGGTVSQPVDPLPPLTIDGEGTISHNPIDPNGPVPVQPIYGGVVDTGEDDLQSAINDFIHSTTVKVPVKDSENVAQPVPVAPDSHHDNGIMPPEHGPQAPEVFM
jgi:hypothetical protein